MANRKYSLPRHTLLARQGARTGAFLVDLAIFLVLTIGLFFGVTINCFRTTLAPSISFRNNEQLKSHLRHLDEDGKMVQMDDNDGFNEYKDVLVYYYMSYLTGEGIEESEASPSYKELIINESGEEVSKKDYYTVEWFNKSILKITSSDPDNDSKSLFTYVKVGEEYDKTQIGMPKDSSIVPVDTIKGHMAKQFVEAYAHFLSLDYMLEVTNKINFIYSLGFVISGTVGVILTYIVLPIILKNGQTVGKKVFRLGLANNEGYQLNNIQLLMRAMPLEVCLLSLLVPVWSNLFVLMLVFLTIFFVSFGLEMASPKRASLHDFTAKTIVIDMDSSIIFKNSAEEEDYLLKEDNIEVSEPVNRGEEPELRYEK